MIDLRVCKHLTRMNLLEQELKTMQKVKAEEKQVLIDKLQRELKSVHSLAEERKNRIESLESESTSKAFSDYKSFRKQMTDILRVKQIGITDEQILLEVNEYKMLTKFWRFRVSQFMHRYRDFSRKH